MSEIDTTPVYQRRSLDIEEIRVAVDGVSPKIRGHASMFDVSYNVPGLFGVYTEEIAPGAFRKSLREQDVRALMNHNPDYVLGRNKAKTLKLAEDDRGLAVEIDPPDTQWARDLMTSMQRGDITQMSFGFIPVQGKDEVLPPKEKGGPPRVRRNEVRLLDVSIVTFPANPETDAYVRSNIDALRRFLPAEPSPQTHSVDSSREPSGSAHSLDGDGSRLPELPAEEATEQHEPSKPAHSLAYYKALLATIENP